MKSLPQTLFKPRFREACAAVPEFKELPGYNATPSWSTFSAQSQVHLASHIVLARAMAEAKELNQAPSLWRTAFLAAGLVVQSKADKPVYISLGSLGMACAILWPVDRIEIGAKRVKIWQPQSIVRIDELNMAYVCDLTHWSVWPCEFVSPARMYVELGHRIPEAWPGVCALHTGRKTVPLLEHAARCSFFNFTKDLLHKVLVQELGQVCPDGADKASLLFLCVKHALKTSDLDAADIIEDAAAQDEVDPVEQGILETDVARECIDVSDHQAVDSYLEKLEEHKQEAQTILQKVKGVRDKCGKSVARKAIAIPKDMQWSAKEVRALLPPNSAILRDTYNCRWRVWYGKANISGTRWSHSVSWGYTHNDEHCARECLQEAWKRHLAAHPGQCPIKGLF